MPTDTANPWTELLEHVVPREPDVGLLRALLWDGAAAREQWARWARDVGDAKAYFEAEYRGRKGLLAFVAHRLGVNEADVSADFATYARVALVREELRSRIYLDCLRGALAAFAAHGLAPVLVNGGAYAFTVYAEPSVRHNHAIDFWVPPEQMDAANAAARAAGFGFEARTVRPRAVLDTYRHGTGLEMTVRSELFLAPHVEAAAARVRSRCTHADLGGARVLVLRPTDRLGHTLGESACSPTRRNLRWACDAYLLLAREEPAFDFAEFVASVRELETALPTARLLRFLRDELRANVPEPVIAELAAHQAPRTARETAIVLSTALRCSSLGDVVAVGRKHSVPWFVRATGFAVWPSREHVTYMYPSRTGAALRPRLARMGRFLARPFTALRRFWRRRVKSIAPEPHAGGAIARGGIEP